MTERAVPFYCPYCGEETLRPSTATAPGPAWWCSGCLRTFVVTFVGLGAADTPAAPTTGANS